MITAQQKLANAVKQNKHICVGLDTDLNKIPKHLLSLENPVLEFNKIVIENTQQEAAAYKINFAFYEKDGVKGFENIHRTIELIPSDILTIGDAKRGDIGNTSEMYADSIFNLFNFDSITLHPYMGHDSIQPFLKFTDKINFVLALTSNPGSSDFEKQKLADGSYLFQKVIEKVNEWNNAKNCGIVFGATNAYELSENIQSFNGLPILLPGVGAQGGNLSEVIKIFQKAGNPNYLINISRALIYCNSSESFGNKIKQEIINLNRAIHSL